MCIGSHREIKHKRAKFNNNSNRIERCLRASIGFTRSLSPPVLAGFGRLNGPYSAGFYRPRLANSTSSLRAEFLASAEVFAATAALPASINCLDECAVIA